MKNMNKNISQFTMIFLLIFIFFATVEHVIDLTKFTFKYNYAFDYGKFIKSMCLSEYFEAETERFQLVTNLDDIKISNTTNKNRYSLFILIISIFVSLYISICFGILVSNLFINNDWIDNALGIVSDKKDQDNLFYRFMSEIESIFNRIVSGFMKLFSKPDWQSVVMAIFVIFIHLVVLVCFIIIPLYLGLKLGLDFDISPIISEEYIEPRDENTDSNLPSGTAGRMKKRYDRFQRVMNYVSGNDLPESDPIAIYVLYILFFLVLIILRFVYKIKGNDENGLFDMISSYFSTNETDLLTSNSMFGYALYFIFIAVFICLFYLLGNSIRLFRKSENTDGNDEADGTLYGNIYGFTEYNNYDGKNLVKKPSGLMFTIIIILFVLISFYFFIPFNNDESDILRYQMILPLAFLAIIMFVVINFTEYNTFANKYIINEPMMLYKKYLGIINPLFNKIISSEYKDMSETTPGYPCRNVINSVYVTLYSHLWNNLNGMKLSDTDKSRILDMTPEMHYSQSCESNRLFQFKNQKKYNFSYYLNNKSLGKNIFYDYHKCSQVNAAIVSQMKKNLQILDDEQQTKIVEKIKEMPTNDKNIDKVNFVLDETFKDEIVQVRDNISHIVLANIKNVLNGNVPCDSNKKIIYYDNTSNKFFQGETEVSMSDIEIFNHNNKLKVFDKMIYQSNKDDYKEYKTFVDEIVTQYMNIFTYNLYALAVSSNDDNKYIDTLTKGIQKSFNSIENIMMTPVTKQKSKLTKYIITNYNTLNNNDIYSNSFFHHIKTNKQEDKKTTTKNIKMFKTILDQLTTIFVELNDIILSFNQNGSISTVRIFTQINDIKEKINMRTKDFNEILKQNESFEGDIELIYNKEDAKYIMEYSHINIETDALKNIQINSGMVNILKKMFDICTITCDEIIKMNELLPAKEIDTEKIDKCKSNLKTFANIIYTNIKNMKDDIEAYFQQEDNIVSNQSTIDYPLKSTSMSIGSEAKSIDSQIYIIYFNVIVSIILSNLIIL